MLEISPTHLNTVTVTVELCLSFEKNLVKNTETVLPPLWACSLGVYLGRKLTEI